jgi:hypothetical protein
MSGRIGNFEIHLVSRRQLGYVTADAEHLEWRIRTQHGLTIARSRVAYPTAEEALAEARRAVARLMSDVSPTPA